MAQPSILLQDQKLFISNQLMAGPNDEDTNFTVDLGSTFECKKMVLATAAIENYFTNLYDLSLSVGGVYYNLQPDHYLTQNSLIAYLNNNCGGAVFSYANTLPSYDQRLEINCDQPVILHGESWYENLGFTLNQPTTQTLVADTVYSFAQSPYICIELSNLPSAISNGFRFTF